MYISEAEVVLLTIAYTDQFSFPLKTSEVCQRLLICSFSQKKVFQILKKLADKELIFQNNGYWQLKTQSANSQSATSFQLRLAREKLSQARWSEVNELIRIVGWIPWVKGIAVTGSFAMRNAGYKSDIDFMIVTAPRRLWMSRLLVVLIAWLAGKRRTWHGDEENSWCFNLWLDSKNLRLLANKQTIYSAYEVCQAKWVLDKDNLAQKFYQENNWVERFLPSYYQKNLIKNKAQQEQGQALRQAQVLNLRLILCWPWFGFLAFVNLVVYALQLIYMYPHMTREKVFLGVAYFHPRNTKGLIYQGWYNSLLDLWKS